MKQQKEFTELYNQFAPGILKLCMGYTGDAALAQDLLQEAFISVWNNMEKFRGVSSWGTWIYRIAVNTCLSHLRKNKEKLLDISEREFSLLPEEVSNKEQEMQMLYRCISQLNNTDRLIISMVLEDKPYDEIAEILDITEANLRVKIHRIKKQLTGIYNSYERL